VHVRAPPVQPSVFHHTCLSTEVSCLPLPDPLVRQDFMLPVPIACDVHNPRPPHRKLFSGSGDLPADDAKSITIGRYVRELSSKARSIIGRLGSKHQSLASAGRSLQV
jgi:hypothetical protein